MIRILFWFWYTVGLLLMMTVGVPEWLAFSNGLFLLFFAVYALHVESKLGEPAALRWSRAAFVGLATFMVEGIGVQTGWPFGAYAYTSVLGAAAFGVPLAIACAWVGVIINGMLVSEGGTRWGRALRTGLWTVLFDLVLDPVAFAREFWIWENQGGFYGVPAVNFISWFFVSALLSLLFPVRSISAAVRLESVRLLQFMLLMFGLLGLKEGLYVPLAIAAAGAAIAEGVRHYDRIREKQGV